MVLHAIDDSRTSSRLLPILREKPQDELVLMIVPVTGLDGSRCVCRCLLQWRSHRRGARALRDFGKPVADQIGPMSYRALQNMFPDGFPGGRQNYEVELPARIE